MSSGVPSILSATLSKRPISASLIGALVLLIALVESIGLTEQFAFWDLQMGHLLFSVIICVLLFSNKTATQELRVRQFWYCVTAAMLVWTLTKLSLVLSTGTSAEALVFQFSDYGFFAFYLIFIFALLFFNSKSGVESPSSLNQFSALIFVSFLFLYLVLIPMSFSDATNNNELVASGFIFFVIMDVYLLAAFVVSGLKSEALEWRTRFFWLASTFLIFALADAIELFGVLGLLDIKENLLIDIFWYLPYVILALAFKHEVANAHIEKKQVSQKFPPLLAFSLAFLPLIHVLGHNLDVFQNQTHVIREWVMIAWVMAYLIMLTISMKRVKAAVIAQQTPAPESSSPEQPGLQPDDIPFAYLELDNVGRILVCNASTQRITGYQSETILGQFFAALLSKDEPLEPMLRFTESSFVTSGVVSNRVYDLMLQHKSGNKIYCFAAFCSMTNSNIGVSLVDVTSLRMSEEHALSIKDKFLANITHEFRTPLTIIQGAVDEAIGKEIAPELKERMVAAKINTVRVLKMVDQLLTLSKVTSAPKLDKQAQPVSEIVRVTCEQFAPICEQKSITFRTELEAGLWAAVHEDALQQILYNLLSNAFKYSEDGNLITLKMKLDNSTLLILVEDTGRGMTEEEQNRLFDRFQRSESVKKSSTFGVGIGLSLVSELVDLHEWQLEVSSKLHQGSCFTLKLPTIEAPSEAEETVKLVQFELESLTSEKTKGKQAEYIPAVKEGARDNRLLIIEDNPDMQDYLKHLMKAHYDVEVVTKGQDGINSALANIPDIIICDLMLPDITGFDVVEKLKHDSISSHIPILMLTAKADLESKLEGLSKRADDYLTKPFSADELYLRLRNLLESREKIQQLMKASLHSQQPLLRESDKPEDNLSIAPYAQFLEKLQAITEKAYSNEKYGLSELANDIAMSERQLQRKLNAALNMTPSEYLKEFRLVKAKDLLIQKLPVGQVAEKVGFSSQAYFTKCFKQSFDCTPSEFVRKSQI